MTTMDSIAMWAGYAVMLLGAFGVLIGCLWLAAEAAYQLWHAGWNINDILDATAEWRRAHPEKYARWKKRNGGG